MAIGPRVVIAVALVATAVVVVAVAERRSQSHVVEAALGRRAAAPGPP